MKIVILGPVASGKTTLSKTLAERLQIPRYEIDEIVHNDETKEKRTKQEQQEILNKILKEKDEWIIEGMPRSHLEVLSISATLILYLDISKEECLKNLKKRRKKTKGEKEAPLEKMIGYIENEKKENLKKIMQKYSYKTIILKSRNDIKKFLIALEKGEEYKYR